METYLVGGAVRDTLLGLAVGERDWVVVGASPEDLLAQGYRPVGKDFPVFLHPDTGEEYALARTERKTGPGYTGFATATGADITLEQDLQRRDLTINAMAQTPGGRLIDPYGGKTDLDNGLLRHVSPAFAEDPVRILRVARFAARLARWGFRVAHETNALMRRMVQNGEVDHLVPERVCAELLKALAEPTPTRFFRVLHSCGALARLFPEISPLFVDADLDTHTDTEPLPVLAASVNYSGETPVRLAALVADVIASPHGFSARQLAAFCERLRLPNAHCELALLTLRHAAAVRDLDQADAASQLALLEALDALRRPERCADFLTVCALIAATRGYPDATPRLRQALSAARAVSAASLGRPDLTGKALGEALRAARITAIAQSLKASLRG
jgi:tRNA nucleotidyltransferase (CCA-adding enzyme)